MGRSDEEAEGHPRSLRWASVTPVTRSLPMTARSVTPRDERQLLCVCGGGEASICFATAALTASMPSEYR